MMSLRSSPMPDLTDDLVEEILARIPATSLNRLRSTCKKWNTLFNDPKFTKKHFDKAEKEYLDLMLRDVYRLSWVSVNLPRLHDNTDPSPIELKGEFSLKKFHNNSDSLEYFEIVHCSGLLLCTSKSTTMVLNPCTGQTKSILPKSPNILYHHYALGYVNNKLCHDYKIVRLLTSETFKLEIFEFNSDSWRVSGSVNPDFILKGFGGVSVKGNTYWFASDNESDNSFVISFDFTTERFGQRVCLPFQDHFYVHATSLYSVREERLSVMFKNNDASKFEIWLTNDIIETGIMSWSKVLWFDFNFTHQFWHPPSFFVDKEKKFAVVSDYDEDVNTDTNTLLVNIIGEERCRKVNLGRTVKLKDVIYCVPRLFSYVPSLVQI